MRRILFVIAVSLFSLSSVMGQMIPVNLPADGNWPTIVGDSIMIIGPRQNELTEEQRYFNPVYLMVYPGKEHLAAQIIRAGLCDCDLTKPNRRIGVFSVAPDKQVSFSQGNLQYLPAINLWKFANTQYESLGNANKYLKPTFRNWVDLFGWSANNTTAPFGVSTSTNVADYAGDFVDWGTNTICGDAPGTWRTLSVDEWGYLFQGRKNATQLYSKGNIDGLRGMIILPDNWVMPEGLHFTAQPTNLTMELDINTYTQAEWQRMEEAGAVFLCPTGRRDGTKIDYLEYYGGYWSSSKISNSNHVCHMYYNYKSKIFMTDYKEGDHSYGTNGRAVRLVHDTIVPRTIPDPCLVVKVNDTLSINMMCVEGGTFTMGDDNTSNASPAHQVTLSDYYIGQTEVTQALWQAVMGNVPTGNKNPSYPVGYVSYADCQDFIVKLNKLTSLHFQLPTEAEWEYAAMGGNRSHGYIYSGSNTIDDVAWYDQNSGNKLHHVGAKQPNELGIYDMSGNAWEWCADYHGKYTAENQINPQGPATGTDRVIRSGSFRTTADRCTNKHRQAREADYPDSHITLRLVLHDTVPEPPKRIGVFSVAADKQVSFSQGNLQYVQSTDEWRFAREQYEYIGAENIKDGALADKIDLFGWSTNNPQSTWGLIFTQSNKYYSGTFVDWGNNLIMGDIAKTWRTLSLHEWTYLLTQRENANNLYTYANINGTNGLVLLPDKWETIDEIPINIATDYSANTFSLAQWETLETRGAVFLPSCGVYMGNNYNHELAGLYWTNTPDESDETKSHCLYVTKSYVNINYSGNRSTNRSVRLVHDTIVPTLEPEYVDLGLSVKWATFNVGATSPEDYGDYFAWGETEPKETYSWATYKWCEGTSTNMTKYNAEDGKTILEPADDAAQVHWGGKWRMPSKEEVDELTQQCNWIWTTHNNVNGYKVTGPNGNSIFLPAAGYKGAGPTYPAGEDGLYWTSTLEKGHYSYLIVLHNDAPPTEASTKGTRCFGFTIRPVYDDVPDPCLVVKVNDTLSINMMCVEGGTFIMGAGANEHQVTLSDYTIGQTEVTQALWEAVMGTNPSANTANKQLPVTNISWYDCQAFINKLNQQTGLRFRLPTEAEWEYAARGGQRSKGYTYAGSNDINDVAWYGGNAGAKSHIVGTKLPNELGIFDMSGNIWEWCAETFDENDDGQEDGAVHGGAWDSPASTCRVISSRAIRAITYAVKFIGFRLVHDADFTQSPEPEYVDLGLSVKWATFNVGATSPEDYGDYFAWGETEPKETYSWATYKWCDGTEGNMTKYNSADGKTILEPADDAAQVQWGGNWRMPTEEEQQELIDRCRWERITLNGVAGYKVIGPNGNSIFIPIAGAYNSFDNQLNSVGSIGWIYSSTIATEIRAYEIHIEEGGIQQRNCSRCVGLTIRPVYDDRPTLTVIPTPEDAKVSFHCSGYQWAGNSITVDKGKDVLYQVTNVDAGYLSQGDSIYKLTKDSVLYVTMHPFSDGNWVKVDNSEYTKQEGYYVSRNKGAFASYSVWNYYVLPVLPGETYRVRSIAGQHAALWIAASTAPDATTNTRPTMISCCTNRGVAAYIADEVTIPDGAKYLIINSRNGKEMMVERKVPDPCLVVKVNDTLSINLMCVEGGTFMMGSDALDAEEDEQPIHEVTLSDYYIGQTEVTQHLWKSVMGSDNNPSATKGNNLPVTNITWDEAQVFVQKLSEMTGLHFRLPTEAEWEYAARGGQKSKGYTYAGSNDIDEVGWYNGNSSNKTHAVGQKQPNELGIYDMTGNVWEYCYDWHIPYSAQAQTNPTGAATGDKHVLRGGCYHYDSKNCTNTNRHSYYTPDKGGASTGLRIVLEP